MSRLSTYGLLAVLVAAPSWTMAASDASWRAPADVRGATRTLYRALRPADTSAGFSSLRDIEEQVFDGDRWLSLRTPRGWQVFIETQHEEASP